MCFTYITVKYFDFCAALFSAVLAFKTYIIDFEVIFFFTVVLPIDESIRALTEGDKYPKRSKLPEACAELLSIMQLWRWERRASVEM